VNEDKISARYENGLQLLTIPKRDEVKQKPPTLISIA
jgi:HSP20 family protein